MAPKDAFPQFNKKYGEQLLGPNGELTGKWEVPAPWQAGLSNVSRGTARCEPLSNLQDGTKLRRTS